ncbi:MAG: YbhB/YbcL family Raf kinase inhibitor-like protein [Candidatus Babeliales bacterium]
MKFQIESSAFKEGGMIPAKYTCDGTDISPPLAWHNAPSETKSFVLICDDPDASSGTWAHWVVYDIPSKVTELSEGIFVKKLGAIEGVNSWGTSRRGYGGPCPPSGRHRYYFKLYALNVDKLVVKVPAAEKANGPRIIEYAPGVNKLAEGILATKNDVLQVMQGHVLAEAQLMGNYERTKK